MMTAFFSVKEHDNSLKDKRETSLDDEYLL
jgi:hypothetical protein